MVEYRKGPPCETENCRSRLLYEENGHIWCRNGHQQPGIEVEAYEQLPSGKRSRRQVEVVEQESRIYGGAKATTLYIQIYQLLLRKQLHALIHTHGFPAQLETVVYDLWALRLQLLTKRLAGGADHETTDGEESRVFSSQAESLGEEIGSGSGVGGKGKEVGAGRDMPTLIETLGICYLGAVLLRIPVSVGSLVRWAMREEIPYIHAVRLVPQSMKSRLPAYYIEALSMQASLETTGLHRAISRLVVQYNKRFGLVLPPLNYPPLLFWFVQQLALPLDIFTAVVQISKVLNSNFEFPKPSFRQCLSALPEVELVCTLVIAVKIYQPFDGLPRYPRTTDEIGILEVDWDRWSTLQQRRYSKHQDNDLLRKDLMEIDEQDVFHMSDSQIDAYLDWYAETWIDQEPKQQSSRNVPEQLLKMFPIEPLGRSTPAKPDIPQSRQALHETMLETLKQVQESLKMRGVVSEAAEGKQTKPVRRIGASYKHYRRVGDLSQHPPAKGFHEVVARVTGLELPFLLREVFSIERRLHRFWEDTQRVGGGQADGRKRERRSSHLDEEADGDSDGQQGLNADMAVALEVDSDMDMEDR